MLKADNGAPNCPYWAPKPEPEHRGLTVKMTCGETHDWDTSQPEVAEIMLHGVVVFPEPVVHVGEPKNEDEVCKVLNAVYGGEWGFWSNSDRATEGYAEWLEWFHSASHNFSIPADPSHIQFVRWAWDVCGLPIPGTVGTYFRKDVKMVNPKHLVHQYLAPDDYLIHTRAVTAIVERITEAKWKYEGWSNLSSSGDIGIYAKNKIGDDKVGNHFILPINKDQYYRFRKIN